MLSAAADDLYTHTKQIDADDLEEAFRFDNIGPEIGEGHRVEFLVERAKSLSVGDVAIDGLGRMFVCCSIGWTEITDGLDRKIFDSLVTTTKQLPAPMPW